MPAILAIIATLLPKLWGIGQGLFSGGSAIIVAIVTTIPPLVEAIFKGLERIAASALLSFLFGGALVGTIAFAWGVSFDAPLRERAQARAVAQANARADVAILKIKADYEAKVAALRKGPGKK